MSNVVYSPQLHQVVRNLKQYDPQEIANFFKDSKWFETWSISAEESLTVVKLFTNSATDSNGTDSSWS